MADPKQDRKRTNKHTRALGKIQQGDCLKRMQKMQDSCIDLVFADPPFNIGYVYDRYDDNRKEEDYFNWCRQWIGEVYRLLKPHGTFWLAIGDKNAAELKMIAERETGFVLRNWVIWYFTFGSNCKKKFTGSHVHLFYFVKDAKRFTFNAEDPTIRVPTREALTRRGDKTKSSGKLPDDTWILRPQAFQNDPYGFKAEQDTWYFPRVAGTFKERQRFHPCQMPEQILGRIIRSCSNEKDVVFDPFVGSGTTLAVAKKLGRRFLGCELSEPYARHARKRLQKVHVGDPLYGRADPVGVP